jgi:hypothetical protein
MGTKEEGGGWVMDGCCGSKVYDLMDANMILRRRIKVVENEYNEVLKKLVNTELQLASNQKMLKRVVDAWGVNILDMQECCDGWKLEVKEGGGGV